MKHLFLSLFFGPILFAAEKPNVLFICIDDLRPELHSFGADYIQSPHIDSLMARGRGFNRHYVQAPTCGASRYALLTGRYGPAGNAAFAQTRKIQEKQATLPAHFRQNGYTTVAVGKISHHPGGLGGSDWNDPEKAEMPGSWDRSLMPVAEWQHPRGAMHGLAHGEIRGGNGSMDVFQSAKGEDDIYPDGHITHEALKQLELLAGEENKPFFLAVGLIKPHLPFGAPATYLEPYRKLKLPPISHPEKPSGKTTWHGSGEFKKYHSWGKSPWKTPAFADEIRKHYAACVTYSDAQVGKILRRLDELGLRENTLIILWGDHGWHLGEHAVWGKHTLFEESLRSPLIIVAPHVKDAGKLSQTVVETIDIYPTLCDLAKLPLPAFLQGRSLRPQLQSTEAEGHPAISYFGNAQTIRTDQFRYISHKNGAQELYDHNSKEGETKNIATEKPEVAAELKELLETRLSKK